MRALVTGSEGFVGGHLRRELEAHGYEVVGLDLRPGRGTLAVNLLDADAVKDAVCAVRPDAVFHLAGQADVAKGWREPRLTMELNVIAAINLLEALRAACPEARAVLVGSADQYGNLGAAGERVSEELTLRPQNPYAVSKKAQEDMARVYARAYGMNVCMTRSFNHGGAGQREGFIIADFAAGIARVERGLASAVRVGNLSAKRSFTHVKDVARAYRLIAERGERGEVYNVGSGTVYSAQEILDRMLAMAVCPIPVERDPGRMRPSDTPVIRCDASKLTARTGWEPAYSIDDILADTLAYYRQTVASQTRKGEEHF